MLQTPYIKRDVEPVDKKRYQTVYASKKGAIASPTAGLHFTKDILSLLSQQGVDIEYVTLHVGYGTFKPVRCIDITRHQMESEYFEIEQRLVKRLNNNNKSKTIAVGTTVCRVLETVANLTLSPEGRGKGEGGIYRGWTDLFIYSPYRFKVVDALLTNFHLPKTTLFMLVSAFCGRELLFKTYQEAIRKRYRFYSYGDAMLVL